MMKVASEDSFYDAKFKGYNPKYININSNSGPIGNLSIIKGQTIKLVMAGQ